MSDDVTLTEQEMAALAEPCACGCPIDDHGTIVKCWRCDDEGRQCDRPFMDLLGERVAGIVAARVEAAVGDLTDRLPELTEGKHREGTAHWPEHARDTYSLAIEEAQAAMRAALASATAPQGEGGEQ